MLLDDRYTHVIDISASQFQGLINETSKSFAITIFILQYNKHLTYHFKQLGKF